VVFGFFTDTDAVDLVVFLAVKAVSVGGETLHQLPRKHTNIDAKLYSNSVAKFKEYCAENNMKIKVKVNKFDLFFSRHMQEISHFYDFI
jgi:hypothetical protein